MCFHSHTHTPPTPLIWQSQLVTGGWCAWRIRACLRGGWRAAATSVLGVRLNVNAGGKGPMCGNPRSGPIHPLVPDEGCADRRSPRATALFVVSPEWAWCSGHGVMWMSNMPSEQVCVWVDAQTIMEGVTVISADSYQPVRVRVCRYEYSCWWLSPPGHTGTSNRHF